MICTSIQNQGYGQILDTLDMRPAVFRKILLYKTRERFIELSSGFRCDRIQA